MEMASYIVVQTLILGLTFMLFAVITRMAEQLVSSIISDLPTLHREVTLAALAALATVINPWLVERWLDGTPGPQIGAALAAFVWLRGFHRTPVIGAPIK